MERGESREAEGTRGRKAGTSSWHCWSATLYEPPVAPSWHPCSRSTASTTSPSTIANCPLLHAHPTPYPSSAISVSHRYQNTGSDPSATFWSARSRHRHDYHCRHQITTLAVEEQTNKREGPLKALAPLANNTHKHTRPRMHVRAHTLKLNTLSLNISNAYL